MSARITLALFVGALAGVFGARVACAEETETVEFVPPFIAEIDQGAQFGRCLDEHQRSNGIGDEALVALFKRKTLGGALLDGFAEALDEGEDKQRVVEAARRDNDAKVDVAVSVFKDVLNRKGDDGFVVMRLVQQWDLARAQALESGCEVPRFLQPGGKPDKEWMDANLPALEKVADLDACLRAFDDEHRLGRFFPIETIPADVQAKLLTEIEARIKALPEGLPDPLKDQDNGAAPDLEGRMMRYQMNATMSFDARHLMKAMAYTGYYRNQTLGAPCHASAEVLRIGEVVTEIAKAMEIPKPKTDSAEGAASMALAEAVDTYRSMCIAPFFEGKDQPETIQMIAAADTAEALLARLAKGAPANWLAVADKSMAIEQRLEGALGLLGMAISHGTEYEKRVAAAYSAEYFPVPQSDICQRPAGLREFVATHDFWAPPATSAH